MYVLVISVKLTLLCGNLVVTTWIHG